MRHLIRVFAVPLALDLSGCGGEQQGDPTPVDEASRAADVCKKACDDELFCNGREICAPGDPTADENGCVSGAAPCAEDSCIEERSLCMASDGTTDESDRDGDGHASTEAGGDDCDDLDANRYPGNTEFCDALHHDEDCDPQTHGGQDQDNDGYLDQACCNKDAEGDFVCGDDCDGDLAWVHPGALELCDGRDNDCDNETDEGSPRELWFADEDGDGYGSFAGAIESCAQPEGYIALPGDCDDYNGDVFPGAPELCDGVFNDCQHIDGGRPRLIEDVDGDGYAAIDADCSGGWPNSDCADDSALVHPGTGDSSCDCSGEVDVAQCGNVVCGDSEKLVDGVCQSCGLELITAESPLVHWRFEDLEGGILHDSSGNGHDGIVDGGRSLPGVVGSSLFTEDFVGSDPSDLGATAGAHWFPGTDMPRDQFSVAFWMRQSSMDRGDRLSAFFGYGLGDIKNNTNHLMFYEENKHLHVRFSASGGQGNTCLASSRDPSPIHPGWQHMAVTYDSSADPPVNIFIDGVSIELTMAASCNALPMLQSGNRGQFTVGQEMDDLLCSLTTGDCTVSLDPNQRFSGAIDEFAIFEKVLSSDTLLAMAKRGSCVDAEDCRGEVFPNGCRAPRTCLEALHALKEPLDGPQWLDADGPAAGSLQPTSERCVHDRDGGGWILMTRHANDGVPTWSYNNRAYFTDDTVFGSAGDVDHDFKSPRTQSQEHDEWLFMHRPSNLWASYDIGEGTTRSFVEHMDHHLIPNTIVCYGNPPIGGLPMKRGNLDDSGNLCSTNLFFSPGSEGAKDPCITRAYNQHSAYGPAWSGHREGDPASCSYTTTSSGLGPSAYQWFNSSESGGSAFATHFDVVRENDSIELYAR